MVRKILRGCSVRAPMIVGICDTVIGNRFLDILGKKHPEVEIETVAVESYEMEDALSEGRIDCHVAPLRDVPIRMDRSLVIAAMLERHGVDDSEITTPAEGIVAIVCRADYADRRTLSSLGSTVSRLEAGVERGMMDLMGVPDTFPVRIRAKALDYCIHVDAVSEVNGDERTVSRDLPIDYVLDEVLDIAEYLSGKRDSLI